MLQGNMRYIGASKIRIGFGGPIYYTYHKEPPQNSKGNLKAPALQSASLDPNACAFWPLLEALGPRP